MNRSADTELQCRPSTLATSHDYGTQALDHEQVQQLELEQVNLPPVDGGRDAWRVLIAAFTFDALFWGFPSSYGIFQAYYSTLPQFTMGRDNIPVVGTLAQAFILLGGPVCTALIKRFPQHRQQMIWLGWPLCILGLLAASFANTVSTLIATQGLIYGLGFALLIWPVLDMLSEWWVTRRGMAFGLISASSGCTGVVMPFIIESLLQKYGYRITLRACAVGMALVTAPLIPLLKGRLPPASSAAGARIQQSKIDCSFLRKPLFYFYVLATMVQNLGFYIPPIFISSYAISIGVSSTQAAALLAVMAASQTMGQFAFGWLSDKKISPQLIDWSLLYCCCYRHRHALGTGEVIASTDDL